MSERQRSVPTGSFLAALTAIAVVISLVTMFAGWDPTKAWPLLLTAIGVAGLYAGLRGRKHPASGYVVPALVFIALSAIFLLFSLKIIPTSLREFVLEFWPLVLVSGTMLVLAAWRFSVHRTRLREERKAAAATPPNEDGGTGE